jgi:hypothetical protein
MRRLARQRDDEMMTRRAMNMVERRAIKALIRVGMRRRV